MKKTLIIAIGAAFILAGGAWWSSKLQGNRSNIVAPNGIHWHSKLMIYARGEEIKIPANIGIGAVHNPIHTHDETSAVHMEFEGSVRSGDIALGQFFRAWGKDVRSFGGNMKMTVNGKENTDYENYVMKNGDNIELRYD